MATAYPFLSPAWMNAARELRETMPLPDTAPPVAVRMNLVVTDTPFDADVHGHVDTTQGEVVIEDGHLEGPDLTVTVDYATARAIFIDQDAAAAMQAFMGGRMLWRLPTHCATSPPTDRISFVQTAANDSVDSESSWRVRRTKNAAMSAITAATAPR